MKRTKRRRAKWPFLIFIPLCLLLVASTIWKKNWKTSSTPEVAPFHPVTWSHFTEQKRLQMLLEGFAIQSMIDIPCVDIESYKKANFKELHYIGITPSNDLARSLQIQFGSELCTFLPMEISIDVLPKADLILCWDQLCTMRPSQALGTIAQFKKSGAHFLLMRHFPEIKKNGKNRSGQMQPVNWTLPPYHFPEPIIQIMEKGEFGMESLALWELEKL